MYVLMDRPMLCVLGIIMYLCRVVYRCSLLFTGGHMLDKVKIGLTIPHDSHTYESIQWRVQKFYSTIYLQYLIRLLSLSDLISDTLLNSTTQMDILGLLIMYKSSVKEA